MSSLCENCKNKIDIYLPKNPMDTLKYQQWHNSEKVDIIGTVNGAFTELKNQLKEFFIHWRASEASETPSIATYRKKSLGISM